MSARVEPARVSAKAKLGALEITDKDYLLFRNSAVKSGISQTADENWKEYTRDNRLLHPDHRHPRETVDTQDGELCAVGASRAKTDHSPPGSQASPSLRPLSHTAFPKQPA